MSVVSAISLPSEVFMVSDSRLSLSQNGNKLPPLDLQRKIFLLSPRFALGFTSNDVKFTLNLVAKLQTLLKKKKDRSDLSLVEFIPKSVERIYRRLAEQYEREPIMEFIYATTDLVNPLEIQGNTVFAILKKHTSSYSVPPEIHNAMITMKAGVMTVMSPTPIVLSHRLPENKVKSHRHYGIVTSGSGSSIYSRLNEEFHNLFCYNTSLRISVIDEIHKQFFQNAGIASIGGLIQVVQIGYGPGNLIQHTRYLINEEKGFVKEYEISFENNKWIETDYINNKTNRISTNPLKLKIDPDELSKITDIYSDYDNTPI